MVKISGAFAPPLSTVLPFFAAASLFYAAAAIALLAFGPDAVGSDFCFIGVIHLYLAGFVMMTILGAMAQLIPVILEKGHWSVASYRAVGVLVAAGTLLLAAGFFARPKLLSYGGALIAAGMALFTADLVMTLRGGGARSLSVVALWTAAGTLVAGIAAGLVMALSLSGVIGTPIGALVGIHAGLMIGGFVMSVIIAVTQILLPMFSLAHGFETRPAKAALLLTCLALLSAVADAEAMAAAAGFAAVAAHVFQVVLIRRRRVRKDNDIWYRSLAVAYGSLIAATVCAAFFAATGAAWAAATAGWLFSVGFLGFLITGHLYKIIPFLVWFARFSPLVGKAKVPMLHQMVPKKGADFQWLYSTAGLTVGAIALALGDDRLWHGGTAFLVVGALALVYNIAAMARFR